MVLHETESQMVRGWSQTTVHSVNPLHTLIVLVVLDGLRHTVMQTQSRGVSNVETIHCHAACGRTITLHFIIGQITLTKMVVLLIARISVNNVNRDFLVP